MSEGPQPTHRPPWLLIGIVVGVVVTAGALLLWAQLRPGDEDSPGDATLADSPWPMADQGPGRLRASPFPAPALPAVAGGAQLGDLSHSGLAIGGHGGLIVGTAGGRISTLLADSPDAPTTGARPLWTRSVGASVAGSPAVRADGGLYVALKGGTLLALASYGAERWRLSAGAELTSPTILADGVVLVATALGDLYALSPSGTLLWATSLGGSLSQQPAVSPDGRIVAATDDGVLRCLTSGGKHRWEATLPAAAGGLAVIRDAVLVATVSGDLLAFDASGNLRWDAPLCDTLLGLCVASDGTTYATGTVEPPRSGRLRPMTTPVQKRALLYAVASDGTVAWSLDLHDTPLAPIAMADGAILVATTGEVGMAVRSTVFAVSADGRLLWDYETPTAAGPLVDMIVGGPDLLYLLTQGQAQDRSGSPSAFPAHVTALRSGPGGVEPYSPPL